MSNFDEKAVDRIKRLEREVERLRVKERPDSGSGVTDHGALTGLSDNDHPQYLLTTGKAADSDKLDGKDPTYFAPASSVVTDHGALTGLSDNDHPQYLLTTGKAADSDKLDGVDSTGFVNTTAAQTVAGIKTFSSIPVLPASDPTTDNQAVRKGYADATYLGVSAAAQTISGAKVVIINPYAPKANVYKGQMHCHSTNSDGYDTPTALVTFYKNAGYHFVSITDHDVATPNPGVSGVLFIPGIEIAADVGTMYHIPVYNTTNIQANKTGQGVLDGTLSLGGYANVAHPNYMANPIPYNDLANLSGYYGIEIYNANCTNQINDPAGYAENRWDELLTDGRRVLGFAVDDNHRSSASWQANAGWVQVFADNLSINSILESLKYGNFYSSTGATLSVSISGSTITATTGAAAKIEWIGKNGAVLRTSPLHSTTDSYSIVGDEQYVRVRVTRDSDSKFAWSNPIWVDLLSAESSRGGGAGTIRGNLHVTTDPTTERGGEISVGASNNYNGRAVLKGSHLTLGDRRITTDTRTSYIYFKTALGNSYDSRIIATGGTDNGGDLTGKLSIQAANLEFNGSLSGTAKASGTDVYNGTSDTKFVTPLSIKNAFGITAAGKALIDDATLSDQRNTLELKQVPLATLSDDHATNITPTNPSGFLLFRLLGSTNYGLVSYDAVSGTAYILLMIGSANVAVRTGILSGTTGTDGKFTVSAHTDGKIYFENRLGSNVYIGYVAI